MGDFRRCDECGDYGWFGTDFRVHRCKPAWECRMSDDDDWSDVRIYASDAEEAAERFAARYDADCGDYPLVSNRYSKDPVVIVRPFDESAPETQWAIAAEMVPHYSAAEIKS